LHVPPHALLALLDEGFLAVRFDLLFAVDAKLLPNLNFHWQPMSIPTRLANTAVSSHRFVSGKHILDTACQAMSRVWHSIGGGWSLEEDK
jgi:hypothetical protein